MVTVREIIELECSDGKWRTPYGLPLGVTTTGNKRVAGYALFDGTCTFGVRRKTREEAQEAADRENARLAAWARKE